MTNLFGLTNTQLVVTDVTPADGVTSGLPTVGSVYDGFNLGNGYENVYTATPDVTTDGVTAPGTVTDTLVTPYGNINLDSLFGTVNYANPLDPGDALTGLQAGDSAIGADAFSIGSVTFDPTLAGGTEGFAPVEQLVGAPPFLDLGGGTPTLVLGGMPFPVTLASQDFNVYEGTATTDQIGSIDTTENVTNLLGLTNTEFTVTSGTLLAGAPAGAELPTDGNGLRRSEHRRTRERLHRNPGCGRCRRHGHRHVGHPVRKPRLERSVRRHRRNGVAEPR